MEFRCNTPVDSIVSLTCLPSISSQCHSRLEVRAVRLNSRQPGFSSCRPPLVRTLERLTGQCDVCRVAVYIHIPPILIACATTNIFTKFELFTTFPSWVVFISSYSALDRQTDRHTNIRGYFYNDMRYINLRFTYLLTYLNKRVYEAYVFSGLT